MSLWTKFTDLFKSDTVNEPRDIFQTPEQWEADVAKYTSSLVSEAAIEFIDFNYHHPKTHFEYDLYFPLRFEAHKKTEIRKRFVEELSVKYNIRAIWMYDNRYSLSRK